MILIKNTLYQELKWKTKNIEIDGKNFYDQQINDSIKQYDEIRKISTWQGDDYTTGFLWDFACFEKKKNRIIAADLSTQKALDADSRAIQQIIFTSKIKSTAKNVVAPLGTTAAASAIDAGIQKKKKKKTFRNNNFNNSKWRNGWYNENYSRSWRF